MNIDKHYPCVDFMEDRARQRLPGFINDYLFGGIGRNISLDRNRETLDQVELMPRFLKPADKPSLRTNFLGSDFDAPFGVAPIGLSGLIWPNMERILAASARAHNIPYTLSTVSTLSLEEASQIACGNAWFQLYTPQEREVREDLLNRCQRAGYGVLVVTVDVPFKTRRNHDIRNGLSVPPRPGVRAIFQMGTHPAWSLRMLRRGIPRFVNLQPYHEAGQSHNVGRSVHESAKFIEERVGLHITPTIFTELRRLWPGKLLVKGVLDTEEARTYVDLGADGLVVSNHGGRQLDAAPSVVHVLPRIRAAVGPDLPIIADSGVRSGLDIARMIALGADFVLLGRAFAVGVAALDRRGGEHVANVLKAELQSTMGLLGCASLDTLRSCRHEHPGASLQRI